jgi:Reverse transcriptase (RNA-dependent DNA polymerase)
MQIALFKADIFKAFDSLNWQFLLRCLRAKGFFDIWISWIQHLILQGHSQVILNSIVGKRIWLKRGMRQGDSISSYLFIIAMDFLASWVQKLNELQILRMPFP